MADPATAITAIAPSPDTTALQSAQTAALAASAKTNEANKTALLTEIAQAELANEALTLDSNLAGNQANAPNDISANDGLLNLNTPTLTLFNEANLRNTNINESLTAFTAQQMQDIGILLKDEQGLEAAANVSLHIPLTSDAATVDLSVEAQAIAEGASTSASINMPTPLTPAQLKQVGTILAPLVDEPLTQPLLLDIQTQLTAIGVSTQQFSLNTISFVMNYIAAMQPASTHLVEERHDDRIENEDEETVAPASPVDRVATEDILILS